MSIHFIFSRGRSFFIVAICAVLLANYVRTFLVQPYYVPTISMIPSLLPGDFLLINKFIFGGVRHQQDQSMMLVPMRNVRRGDVVIFRSPKKPTQVLIKRCIALPNEVLEVEGDRLQIDGHTLDESGYVNFSASKKSAASQYLLIPDDSYFCLGDHRDRSRDSRVWGPVAAPLLRGRAWLIYWSYDSWISEEEDGQNQSFGSSLSRAGKRLSRSRIHRVLKIVR